MATNYIPAREGDFVTWLTNFNALILASPTTYGLTAGDATALDSMTTTYITAYNLAIAGGTRGPSPIAAKDAARANVTARARQLATIIQSNPSTTDVQKTDLGLTLRKTNKTPIPPPTTSPLLSFVAATPLQHTLRFADQLTPDARAKPFGVIALQLSVIVSATPPIDGTAPNIVLQLTRNPAPVNFNSGDVRKTAYYTARWQTRTGDLGPISTQLSAVII